MAGTLDASGCEDAQRTLTEVWKDGDGRLQEDRVACIMLPALLYAVPLLAVVTANSSDQDASRPLVATREGLVRGVIARSAAGRLFYSFKAIRYARAPVGALRFQPPQRHPGWSGVTDGLLHGSVCPQLDLANFSLKGSEDCLFANVYTPQLPTAPRAAGGLPVMVLIHGGGFTMGSGDDDFYGPSYFMDEDVVLVTFNYRLGPLGLFTTNDNHAPGNYALLDQVLLLQWVQDNIASFGGDPGSVTVFGVSAGGSSVSILVLSPLARGLFHHAISQSGTALAGWALGGRKSGIAQKLADRLNCSTEDVGPMVECIRDQPWESILANTNEDDMKFQVRVDREAETPLVPDDPRSLLARGEFNLVPWMHGLTQEEAALFVPLILSNKTLVSALFKGDLSAWSSSVALTAPSKTNILDCGADVAEEAKKVYDFYIGDANITLTNLLPLVQAWSDRMFVAPMAAETTLASRHAPVYRYLLDHTGPGRLSLSEVDLFWSGVPDLGTTHGDDILYLFSNAKLPLAARDSPTYTMIRFMVSLWASFARTGRPSSTVLPTPDWPVFTEHHRRHMRLNSAPSVGERLFQERADFWQTVRVNEPWRHVVEECEQPRQEDAY